MSSQVKNIQNLTTVINYFLDLYSYNKQSTPPLSTSQKHSLNTVPSPLLLHHIFFLPSKERYRINFLPFLRQTWQLDAWSSRAPLSREIHWSRDFTPRHIALLHHSLYNGEVKPSCCEGPPSGAGLQLFGEIVGERSPARSESTIIVPTGSENFHGVARFSEGLLVGTKF